MKSNHSYTYSAPAKIILSGEHAVVYGKPALICALDLRLTVSVAASRTIHADEQMQYIAQKVREYLTRRHIAFNEQAGYRVTLRSRIPSGRNLGSSAALSVAASAAFLHFYTKKAPTPEVVNSVAYEVEKRFHGNPSGADNSTSCFGGLIYYRKEFEFLKHISALHAKLPAVIADRLLIIQTGKPKESTAEMVAAVGRAYNKNPVKIEAAMNLIEKATKKMTLAITGENPHLFEQAITDNQKQLEVLQVVSSSTKELLRALSPFGLGKVTGGGGIATGSGNLLFMANNIDTARAKLDELGISYLPLVQDYKGLLLEA